MMLRSETVEILAHQGGWDELALLSGPVLVILVLGYLARRGIDPEDEEADADNVEDDRGRPRTTPSQ